MAESELVGMAEYRVARSPARLGVRGLGSCVVLALWDPGSRVGALAHSMLPAGDPDPERPAKYCDRAARVLLDAVARAGGDPAACRAHLVGGASMFQGRLGAGPEPLGVRNLDAARAALRSLGLPLLGEDCGGGTGRSLDLDCRDGSVRVWSAWTPERVLRSDDASR